MNILTDLPIDTTNLAYMRFIELQKNLDDRLNVLENHLRNLENEKNIEKVSKKAIEYKDKSANHGITVTLALYMFAASLFATVIVTLINSPYLKELTFMGYDMTLILNIFLLSGSFGSLLISSFMLKNFIEFYFYYVPTKTKVYNDGLTEVTFSNNK
jgi:hypothetical protein